MIDEAFYPHIIDLIFAYAPRESLLVMRAASHDWCRRTDGILAEHLILRGSNSPKRTQACMSLHGRLPSAEPLFRSIDEGGAGCDWGSNSTTLFAGCDENAAATRFYDSLAHVRVLEMDTLPGEHPPVAQYANLQVVKLLGLFPPSGRGRASGTLANPWTQAPTVIAFSALILDDNHQLCAYVRQDFVPRQRFVLNIFDLIVPESWPVGGVKPLMGLPETLEHVVFILHLYKIWGPESPPPDDSPRYPLRSLCIVADALMACISETITITIVRPEEMERCGYTTPLPPAELPSTTAATLRDLVRQASETRHLGWNNDDVHRLASAVQVLTHREYSCLVGQRQYEYEVDQFASDLTGLWLGYGPPPQRKCSTMALMLALCSTVGLT